MIIHDQFFDMCRNENFRWPHEGTEELERLGPIFTIIFLLNSGFLVWDRGESLAFFPKIFFIVRAPKFSVFFNTLHIWNHTTIFHYLGPLCVLFLHYMRCFWVQKETVCERINLLKFVTWKRNSKWTDSNVSAGG